MAVASDASWGGVSSPELCFCVSPLWILIPNWCLALAVLQLPHAGARDIPEHRPLAEAVAWNIPAWTVGYRDAFSQKDMSLILPGHPAEG